MALDLGGMYLKFPGRNLSTLISEFRRKCPGQYLAAKSVWIAIVRLLWAFDMQPGQDSSGNSIPVDPENCTSGMTSCVEC